MDLETALRSIPALAALSDDERAVLASAFVVESRPDGYVLAREGKRPDSAFLVLEGTVVVTTDREGGRDVLERLGPGELVGLVSLVDDAPRSASCRAEGPVRVAELPHSAFVLLFNTAAPIAFALQHALAEQLARDFRHLDEQIRAAYHAGDGPAR